jgi:site-specific recombinase XerD
MLTGKDLNQELTRRFDRWLFTQKYTEGTRERYTTVVLDFCAFFGDRSVITANHFDIREYLAFRSMKGNDLPTLRTKLHGLRIFFDFLNMGGLVRWVAPRLVAVRQGAKKLPRFLTEMQVHKLLKAARNPRDRALIELVYGTGCRMCELTSMRVEDIDFYTRKIRVTGKANRPRFVLFGPPAAKALREYLGTRREGFVSWTVSRISMDICAKCLMEGGTVSGGNTPKNILKVKGAPNSSESVLHLPLRMR